MIELLVASVSNMLFGTLLHTHIQCKAQMKCMEHNNAVIFYAYISTTYCTLKYLSLHSCCLANESGKYSVQSNFKVHLYHFAYALAKIGFARRCMRCRLLDLLYSPAVHICNIYAKKCTHFRFVKHSLTQFLSAYPLIVCHHINAEYVYGGEHR